MSTTATTTATTTYASEASNRLNSSTLIIGETKSGKTTLIATMAEWLWEEHRKVLFFNTAELGGFSARVEQRIRQGLIRPFRMRTRDDVNNSLSFETLHLSSKGYVPTRFIDHLTGVVEPGVPMVPPVQVIYAQSCPSCGEVLRSRRQSVFTNARSCARCHKPVPVAHNPPVSEVRQTPGFEQIGTMGFDGLTSFSDWYLQDMSHRKNLEGEKAALGGDIVSGDMVFRGNNRSQVGQAQTRVHELVANSLGIPNLVVMPVWTAISHESSDDTGRLQIVGPKLAGDAKTYIAASWFGSVLEAQVVATEKNEYVRRLYVTQWYDEFNRRHMCGHRGDPRFMPVYIEDEPYSAQRPPTQLCTGFSLANYQRLLEESIRLGIEADTAFQDAPGMAAIPATYGDETDVERGAAGAGGATGVPGAAASGAQIPAARPTVRPRQQPRSTVARQSQESPAAPATPGTPADVAELPKVSSPAAPEPANDAPADAPPVDAGTASTAGEEDVPLPRAAPEMSGAEVPGTGVPGTGTGVPVTATGTAEIAGTGVHASTSTAWTRPAGARPQSPPRAPQPGPRAPVRAGARPVQAVKAQ